MKQIVWPLIFISGFAFGQLEGVDKSKKLKKAYYLTSAYEPSKKKGATYMVTIQEVDEKHIEVTRKQVSSDRVVLSAVLEKQDLDNLCGTVKKYGAEKAMTSTVYRLGLKHGEYLELDEKGEMVQSGNYENDNRVGQWKVRNDKGFYDVGAYREGKRNGEWQLGNGSGKPDYQFYSNGTPLGDRSVDWNAKSIVSIKRPDLGKYKSDYGIINMKGEVVVPLEYRSLRPYGKVVKATKDELNGYVDWNGKVVIPLEYDQISDYRKGLMFVKKGKKYGAINQKNEVVIPLIYEKLPWTYNGHDLIKAKKNGKWGYIDKTGRVKIPFKYDLACDFYRYEAYVKQAGRWYKIDKTGLKKRPYHNRWDECDEDIATEIAVEEDSQFGRKKYTVTGETFTLYKSPRGWRAGRYGVKDDAGNWVVPKQYKYIYGYENGMIMVKDDNDKVGFYNDRGQLVIPPKYDRATDFGWRGWDD